MSPLSHAQNDVHDFHVALEVPHGKGLRPEIRRPELRAELIREEAKETVEAIEDGDVALAIDGMIDTIYVCLGTFVEWGLDVQPFWDEIQKTNLAKAGGKTREDGKKLKPEGWEPPRIKELFDDQVNQFIIRERGLAE